MIISLDSETTGLDLRHGAKPFLVTIGQEDGTNTFWEWEVDPKTREPLVVDDDLIEIQEEIDAADIVVLQNPKFDVAALQTVFLGKLRWNWSKVRDTLLAGHLLASNQPHDLTTMALVYLGVNIQPYEEKLKVACNEARRIARSKYPDWRIASKGLSEMPSAKDSVWKFDAWLPRLLAEETGKEDWLTVTSTYANWDSAVTLPLYQVQEREIRKRGLWKIYEERLKVLPIVYAMEEAGVTINRERLERLRAEYSEESERAGRVCVNIAKSFGFDLTLPKSGNNGSLTEFAFGPLGLQPQKASKKTGKPSLDKSVLEHWEATLPERSKQLTFVRALKGKRKRDTALSYMEGYEKFWKPHYDSEDKKLEACFNSKEVGAFDNWFRLHPSLNPTGTDTLRWSSQQPNEQNISKQEGFNLRYMFGPAPGREWWSLDAKNLELRIPAYESGEREMVELFDNMDNPPYFGSYHLLIFDTLHPDKFAKHGVKSKDVYESTWYQWTKNGNFAVTYGAVEASGTADRAYHIPGAQRRIQQRFKDITKLNQKWIEYADKFGYVETISDRTVDPSRGYPLLCTRSNWGKILPTVPLNYHVQGTAMWWMMKAMIRVQAYLDEHNENRERKYHAHLVMQVHDELVIDFPKSSIDPTSVKDWKTDKFRYLRTNVPQIREIKKLMEQGGDDIGVPTPVSCEYHANNWSEGVAV